MIVIHVLNKYSYSCAVNQKIYYKFMSCEENSFGINGKIDLTWIFNFLPSTITIYLQFACKLSHIFLPCFPFFICWISSSFFLWYLHFIVNIFVLPWSFFLFFHLTHFLQHMMYISVPECTTWHNKIKVGWFMDHAFKKI